MQLRRKAWKFKACMDSNHDLCDTVPALLAGISCVFVFISSLRTWFKYMKCMNVYHFIFIFPGPYITSHFNDQLLVGLVAQLIRALQRSAVRIRIPASWIFFTLSFCTCISFVVIFFTFFNVYQMDSDQHLLVPEETSFFMNMGQCKNLISYFHPARCP